MTNGSDLTYPLDIGEGMPETGLTKREYFAATAMQGLAANSREHLTAEDIAREAVETADALIEVLNKTRNYVVEREVNQ